MGKQFECDLADFIAGKIGITLLADKAGLTEKALRKRLLRRGYGQENYVFTAKGVLDKSDPQSWKDFHNRYMEGEVSSEDLAVELEISPQQVLRVFRALGWLVKDNRKASQDAQAKRSKTMIDRYGVENTIGIPGVLEKMKNTLQERYGVDHPMHSSEIVKKLQKTRAENKPPPVFKVKKEPKYGFQDPLVQEKARQTVLERYGVANPFQIEEVKEKTRNTLQQLYGVDHPMHNAEIKARVIKTNLELYGAECSLSNPKVREKVGETNRQIYGHSVPAATAEVRKRIGETRMRKKFLRLAPVLAAYGYEILEDYKGLVTHNNEEQTYTRYRIRHVPCGLEFEDDVFGLPRCPTCYPLIYRRSQLEDKYAGKVATISGVAVQQNVRPSKMLSVSHKRYEIDILVDSVAFEVNGLYWHSDHKEGTTKGKPTYHQEKSDAALKVGIKLYHIWEHHDPLIVESKIAGIFGKLSVIGARKTILGVPPNDEAEDFYESSHLAGYTNSFATYGLKYEGQWVAMISFRRLSEIQIEISRFAQARGLRVQGSFGKLLKYALPRIEGWQELVTYADRDWSPVWQDTVYCKYGFRFIGDTGPSMYYTDFHRVHSRQNFQKFKLKRLLGSKFDINLTEKENLALNGIYAIYTSGNWKFVLAKKDISWLSV